MAIPTGSFLVNFLGKQDSHLFLSFISLPLRSVLSLHLPSTMESSQHRLPLLSNLGLVPMPSHVMAWGLGTIVMGSPVGAPITDTHHTHVQIIRQPRLPYHFLDSMVDLSKVKYVVKKVEWEMRLYMCTRAGLLHV